MDKFDSIQQLHRLFSNHKYGIPLSTLAERLECSKRTVLRHIKTLQQYDAPLDYDASQKGWRYDHKTTNRFELPGLWLTADELQSLSLLLNLLDELGPGQLKQELNPIESAINKLLTTRGIQPNAFRQLIKILPINNRQLPNRVFQHVSEALLNQQQLDIHYESYNHSKTERRISPQTLIYYRENWYLDAWCHLRQNLRTFSLARINQLKINSKKSKQITEETKQMHFAQAYGIFSGKPKHTAKLRFLPSIAREIALQQWHP